MTLNIGAEVWWVLWAWEVLVLVGGGGMVKVGEKVLKLIIV